MEKSSSIYNISELLLPKSKNWQRLLKLDALFRLTPKSQLKIPLNFVRSIMEQLENRYGSALGYGTVNLKYYSQWQQQAKSLYRSRTWGHFLWNRICDLE